jgi:hypothetical protein
VTEERATKWVRGQSWPSGWKAIPLFVRAAPPGLRFVEVVNSTWMIQRMGYPSGLHDAVPDRLGETDSGEYVLWEEKSKDNVSHALRQLDEGMRNLRTLGRPVQRVGVVLEKFDPKEHWACSPTGYLIRREQLGAAPHELSSLRVMVEIRKG